MGYVIYYKDWFMFISLKSKCLSALLTLLLSGQVFAEPEISFEQNIVEEERCIISVLNPEVSGVCEESIVVSLAPEDACVCVENSLIASLVPEESSICEESIIVSLAPGICEESRISAPSKAPEICEESPINAPSKAEGSCLGEESCIYTPPVAPEGQNICADRIMALPLLVNSGDCKPRRQYRLKFLGEFLYWRALEEGGQSDCDCSSEWKNHHWSAGCRLGVGCQSICSDCQGDLVWTHYQQYPHHGCKEECGDHWKLRYDTIDALFTGALHLNSCLNISPFWGIRGAYIRQNIFSVCNIESKCVSDNFSFTKERKDKANFKAVGPLVGVGADYKLSRCFSFFGNFDLGLLYGNHQLKSYGADTFTELDQKCICCEKRREQASQLFIDIILGVRWEQTLCRDITLIHQLGVEHHRYVGFNHIGSVGDLCFDGVNLSLGIGF